MTELDVVTQCQILLETLDKFQTTPKNRQKIKQQVKGLIQSLEASSLEDYNKMFQIDQEAALTIQENYLFATSRFAERNIPDKVFLAQMLMAVEKDKDSMEANVFRILKK